MRLSVNVVRSVLKASGSLLMLVMVPAVLLPTVFAAQAGTLSFDPSTVTSTVGATFQVDIVVDAEDKEILGVDALLEYNTSMLEVQSISDGTYLSIGQKDSNEQGKIYVAGVVDSPGEAVTGKGVLATITFKVKAGGQAESKYICEIGETNESNISENSTDAPDLIECSSNGTLVITVSGGTDGGDGTNTTPTPGSGTTGGTSGGTTGGTSGGSGGGSGSPSTLPQSGLMDNFLAFAAIGGILLVVGAGAKLFLM